ncbi:MAG: hypothetical protein LBU16_06975 [Treponema sp.]|jgi:hypothetical protein|nr:hypothetical protein [Treponema sp.]
MAQTAEDTKTKEPGYAGLVAISEDSSNLAKTYKKIVALELDYAQKGVDAVQAYVDLPEETARSAGTALVDFSEIGRYLPSDLSALKRIKPGDSRNALPEEVTLEDELNALAEEFSLQLQEALPDPSMALTLPFVTGTEEGLQIGGGTIIPYGSLNGAITVEILNAFAAGEDVDALVSELADELSPFIADAGNESRAVSKNGDGRWVKGHINYRWGSISEEHKTAVKTAMATWKTKTNGKVCFDELANGVWENFQLGIHAIGCVIIYDATLPDKNGLTSKAGYSGGFTHLVLNELLHETIDLQSVPLHELGHVLGLYHEHQRYDRDEWVIVNESGVDYAKIPKTISGLRIEWLRIKVGWWTISIPYPIFWETDNSTTYGPFDFSSIMLYWGLEVKKTQGETEAGSKTKNNLELSYYDIEAIKKMY